MKCVEVAAKRMKRLITVNEAKEVCRIGNAPVAPLELHGVVGGGNHLSSGDPNARLPCLFLKKKKNKKSVFSPLLSFKKLLYNKLNNIKKYII